MIWLLIRYGDEDGETPVGFAMFEHVVRELVAHYDRLEAEFQRWYAAAEEVEYSAPSRGGEDTRFSPSWDARVDAKLAEMRYPHGDRWGNHTHFRVWAISELIERAP